MNYMSECLLCTYLLYWLSVYNYILVIIGNFCSYDMYYFIITLHVRPFFLMKYFSLHFYFFINIVINCLILFIIACNMLEKR